MSATNCCWDYLSKSDGNKTSKDALQASADPPLNNNGYSTRAMEQGHHSPPNYDEIVQTRQHTFGAHNEASHDDYLAALEFIRDNPREMIPPSIALPPWHTYSFSQPLAFGRVAIDGVSVTEEGCAITFSSKRDTSILCQYPVPSEASTWSATSSVNAITSQKYYYEIEIIQKTRQSSTIAIGFATRPYPSFRLPGWEAVSVGYHSDDGRKFLSDPMGGMDYAAGYAEGDIIGCGYDPASGSVYYTRNGRHLGVAFSNIRAPALYPCIGADDECTLYANFGAPLIPIE
ncbi:concanavalin A-like lectin/glucanase domain-containing protein [Syncephalis plumigaleata]|nr:concanavalin A-like lectin/glucanase domain-containing protein [Syncephalis plumigaleata]